MTFLLYSIVFATTVVIGLLVWLWCEINRIERKIIELTGRECPPVYPLPSKFSVGSRVVHVLSGRPGVVLSDLRANPFCSEHWKVRFNHFEEGLVETHVYESEIRLREEAENSSNSNHRACGTKGVTNDEEP